MQVATDCGLSKHNSKWFPIVISATPRGIIQILVFDETMRSVSLANPNLISIRFILNRAQYPILS